MPRPDRPTTDPRRPVIDTFDFVWNRLIARLDGITTEELAWQPVPNAWVVQVGPDETAIADAQDFEAPAGPVPTINWRLWHIAIGCLDDYSQDLFERTGASVSGQAWHLEPGPAIDDMHAAYRCFRGACMERSADEWWAEIGEKFGPWQTHSMYDLVQHALDEITHHGAEVALLRDLYRER